MQTAGGVALLVWTVVSAQSSVPTDWPQWRGPDRSGISRETGLLQTWPQGGPARVWTRANLGGGYGSLSVAGGRVFVQGRVGRDSAVHSLSINDGTVQWTKVIGAAGNNDRGPGPRGTPTVDGDRLYVLTETGDLVCLRVNDGSVVWRRNILADFQGRQIEWHISESPLVDGARLVVSPGGRGAGIVALDKMTGRTIWTATELSDEPGYSSAVIADVEGVRAYATFTAAAAVGVRATDGKLLWRHRPPANNVANITTPVIQGNRIFYSSAYDTGGSLLELRPSDGALQAQEVYFTRDMQNHHGGMVLVNGVLYGFNNAILTALDFASGRMLWRDRSVGKASVIYADNRLYALGENHVVGLAEVTPDGYREHGRFTITDEGWPSWAHPVVSGGRLYIRNQGTLTAYDVRAR
jgi:outer membrane protein assembly factor BamB